MERQGFVTRQTQKQQELERNGITSVSLLPSRLRVPVSRPCGTQSRAEVTSSRYGRVAADTKSRMRVIRPTPNNLESQNRGHGLRAVEGQDLSDCSKLRSDRLVVDVDRPINSTVMTSSKGGESVVTSPGKFKTAMGSSQLMNNYSTSVHRQ